MVEVDERIARLEERFEHASSVRRRDWWWIGAVVIVALSALGITGWVEARRAVAEKYLEVVKDDLETRIGKASILANDMLARAIHVPVGTIVAFAGAGEPPTGWVVCDGVAIDENQEKGKFKALIGVIGRTWGDGGDPASWVGESTPDRPRKANLPKLDGIFLRGRSALQAVGIPQESAAKLEGEFTMQAVRHPSYPDYQPRMTFDMHEHDPVNDHDRLGRSADGSWFWVPDSPVKVRLTGGADETRPKNVAVTWIIKY